MRRSSLWGPVALTFLLVLAAAAAERASADEAPADPLLGHPGFFDLDALGLFDRDELDVHISVKGPLLDLVAAAARESEPELAAALGALEGIEVRVYDASESKREGIEGLLQTSAGRLTREGWQTALTVRVKRDHGYALLRFADPESGEASESGETKEKAPPRPIGLVAMYLTEANEAVFVNIVGTIDTATVSQLARRYDLDLLAVGGALP